MLVTIADICLQIGLVMILNHRVHGYLVWCLFKAAHYTAWYNCIILLHASYTACIIILHHIYTGHDTANYTECQTASHQSSRNSTHETILLLSCKFKRDFLYISRV